MHCLRLSDTPTPQLWEHSVHSLHGPHTPSSASSSAWRDFRPVACQRMASQLVCKYPTCSICTVLILYIQWCPSVTLNRKTSHKGQFSETEMYAWFSVWMNLNESMFWMNRVNQLIPEWISRLFEWIKRMNDSKMHLVLVSYLKYNLISETKKNKYLQKKLFLSSMTLTLYDFCTTLKKLLKTVDKAVWLLMSLYEQTILRFFSNYLFMFHSQAWTFMCNTFNVESNQVFILKPLFVYLILSHSAQ